MKKQLILIGLILLVVPVVAQGADQFSGAGYSYWTPPEIVGTSMTLVGRWDPPAGFTYPISVDFVANEYTFEFTTTISSITPSIITTEYVYAATTITVYEDGSKDSNYGTNPPNATSPSTFTNGTAVLVGTLSGLTRIDFNAGFPEPTFVGNIDWTGGTKLAELAPHASNGWTIHGAISSTAPGIPTGYQRVWTPKIVPPAPVPVEESTWGAIKSLYETNN